MIRYPNIVGATEAQKLEQMKSYLHQLADELNYHLDNTGNLASGYQSASNEVATPVKKDNAVSNFNDIKALIIKSADIVNAYYDVISKKLTGMYVAESDFGTYAQQTSQDILANSTNIESIFSNIQAILSDVEGIESSLIEVDAHIKAGHLYDAKDGTPVYGLEVGQRTEIDGVEVFNKYAQFTSDRLSFYDQNGREVAYISDRKLYITTVEIGASFIMGGFVDEVQKDRSIVTKWV